MVCNRCKMVVKELLTKLRYHVINIDLGVTEVKETLTQKDLSNLNEKLKDLGFEILETSSQKDIQQIKNAIIQKIAEENLSENFKLSYFLAQNLHKEYSSISKIFSQNQAITLEQYFILQKIEKVKELLFYNEYTLTEIAGMLGYKSVQHLSAQFKTVTGFTPSRFKKLKSIYRTPLDEVS